jgi:hypothetical protein
VSNLARHTPQHDSNALRKAALTRLAVATREKLPEDKRERDAYFHVYLDGMEKFSDDTFVRACKHLEVVLSWFPKKAELIDACESIVRRKRENERPRLALPEGVKPVSAEQQAEFLRRVRAAIGRKSF